MPSNKLKESFFSYEMTEKNTIYFSMLFDHTPVNIMVSVSCVLVLTIIFCQEGSAIISNRRPNEFYTKLKRVENGVY